MDAIYDIRGPDETNKSGVCVGSHHRLIKEVSVKHRHSNGAVVVEEVLGASVSCNRIPHLIQKIVAGLWERMGRYTIHGLNS